MEITREKIEERLAALRAGLARLQSDVVATEGGIQDCEYWLSVLDAEPAPVDAKPKRTRKAQGA